MGSEQKPVLILSTDLDGTLLGRGNYEITGSLPRVLEELDTSYDVRWMINTGRRYYQLYDLVNRAPIERYPDYLVDRETFLYERVDGKYVPVENWNAKAQARVEAVEVAVASELVLWSERIGELFPEAKVRLDSGVPLSVQSKDSEQSYRVRDALTDWSSHIPGIRIIRNGIWISIWADGCDKGAVLEEVARRHAVPVSRIMAVGDSDNDLAMLDPRVCGFSVAPANAELSVKEFVAAQGGYISDHPDIDGVMDGVRHFINRLHGQ